MSLLGRSGLGVLSPDDASRFLPPRMCFLGFQTNIKGFPFHTYLEAAKGVVYFFLMFFRNEYLLKIDGWKMYCIFRIEIVLFFLELVSFREGELWYVDYG